MDTSVGPLRAAPEYLRALLPREICEKESPVMTDPLAVTLRPKKRKGRRTPLTCVTCRQPIDFASMNWNWLDAASQPEHNSCFDERFAREFPDATKVYKGDRR